MATQTTLQKDRTDALLKELREVKAYLKKLLLVIPQEGLDEYENVDEIKNAYSNAVRDHSSSKYGNSKNK